MKRFFYSLAFVFAFLAFILFMYPIVTSLPKIRDGISAFISFGIITSIVPVTLALAVIPLCLAIAFDFATRD